MKLVGLRGGDIVMDRGRAAGGEPGEKVLCPIMSFLLVVGDQRILFDTGMNPAVRDDAVAYWGRIANRVIVPNLPAGNDVVSLLSDAGYPAETITIVVNSHLHNDHAGTNLAYPNARVLVREVEWAHALTQMDEPSSGYVRNDFYDDNRRPELLDYESTYNVLEDGSVQLVSTKGHSPGHQSMRVTFPSGRRFVLTGDAVYFESDLLNATAPVIAWDSELAQGSVQDLRRLQYDGDTILICHEEKTWRDVERYVVVHEES